MISGYVFSGLLGFYIDFIKDIFIAANVTFLFTAAWDFKSLVVTLLWVTVFLSQTLIGIKLVSRGPARIFGYTQSSRLGGPGQRLLIWLFLVLSCPLAPALLLFLSSRLGWQMRPGQQKFAKLIRQNTGCPT